MAGKWPDAERNAFIDVVMEQGLSMALGREMTRRHTPKGIGFMRVPVFGRPDVVQAGKLNTFAAGDAKAIVDVSAIL